MNKFEGFSLIFVLCFTNREGNEINIRSDIILSFFSRFVFTQKTFFAFYAKQSAKTTNEYAKATDAIFAPEA